MISWNKYKTERNYFDKCYKSSVEIKDFNALIKKITKKPRSVLVPDFWFLSCNKKF